MGKGTREPSGPVFVRGNDHLARLLSDPERAARVEKIREATEEMNRVYAMNLAMIRKALDLTQVEMATRLKTDQGSVSRIENREDMLLSTLADYLMATGADYAAIVVRVHGQEFALDLDRYRTRESA
jgi:DNA-binding transcriptional regulator YiaG